VRDRRRGRRVMVKNLTKQASSREDRFPKTSPGAGSLRTTVPETYSPDRRCSKTYMCWCFRGCWYIAIFMAVARIYRKDPPRVIASCNRLVLSQSNRIRHGLVAKINEKRRPRACEALGRILVDYSRARCAPAPIASPHLASPRHATPRPTR
jgi:hypothetical protein